MVVYKNAPQFNKLLMGRVKTLLEWKINNLLNNK